MMTPSLTTLTFTIRQDDKLSIPPHSGSMIRGAFGTALRQLSCLTDLPNCQLCPMNALCAYTTIFENMNDGATNPYVLRLPKSQTVHKNQTWQFGMTLIGTALEHTELIIKAIQLAVKSGLGGRHSRATGKLMQVVNVGQVLFDEGKITPITPRQLKQIPLPNIDKPAHITLRFVTPFRLQYQGKIAHQSHQLDEKQLLINLYNRAKRCQNQHDKDNHWQIGFDDFNDFKAILDDINFGSEVQPVTINRHSSRQGRKITLFGMMGDVKLQADGEVLTRLLPLLWYGQYLHVGKSTTLGLGRYQMMIHQNS